MATYERTGLLAVPLSRRESQYSRARARARARTGAVAGAGARARARARHVARSGIDFELEFGGRGGAGWLACFSSMFTECVSTT